MDEASIDSEGILRQVREALATGGARVPMMELSVDIADWRLAEEEGGTRRVDTSQFFWGVPLAWEANTPVVIRVHPGADRAAILDAMVVLAYSLESGLDAYEKFRFDAMMGAYDGVDDGGTKFRPGSAMYTQDVDVDE